MAQVGRSIADRLIQLDPLLEADGWIDPDSVEAACLAHDLGHPPFGHNSERELDEILYDRWNPDSSLFDGFEGNAQSFRIVTKLAARLPKDMDEPGLNLTAGTLNALLKYPETQDSRTHRKRKWGYYLSERDDFDFCRQESGYGQSTRKSIEAEIMDISDDITYAVHDAEDFFRAGLLPLNTMSDLSEERQWFLDRSGLDRDRASAFLDGITITRFQGTYANLAQLAEFRSSMVNRFIGGIAVHSDDGFPSLHVNPDDSFDIAVLKDLTTHFVIESPSVQKQRYGQRRMIRTLFDIYLTEATLPTRPGKKRRDNLQVFPPLYQEFLESVDQTDTRAIKRHIADLISSMAETQVVDTFQKLTGLSQGSVVDPIA